MPELRATTHLFRPWSPMLVENSPTNSGCLFSSGLVVRRVHTVRPRASLLDEPSTANLAAGDGEPAPPVAAAGWSHAKAADLS